jgi:hypothetical protein
MALRTFPIDKLSPQIRANALRAISEMIDVVGEMELSLDDLLKNYAMSAVLEDGTVSDEELERRKNRTRRLADIQAAYPGNWRSQKGRQK